jgi:hypothetical protein
VHRRGARARAALGLASPLRRSTVLALAAIVLLAALVGVASAQPVVVGSHPRLVRTDAEVYFVFDITRSMLASPGPREANRLARARTFARRVRDDLPDVPSGIASFTNRLVPHIFPTSSLGLFSSGLDRSLAVERPAPDRSEQALVTAFDSLAPLQTNNFFSPAAESRVAVVLTDGESQPVSPATLQALRSTPRVDLLLVRFWSPGERIFRPRIALDRDYRPDPGSTATFAAFADSLDAHVYGEGDESAVAREVRRLVGRGEPAVVGREASETPLSAWILAAGIVPLGYLLLRRNVL